MCSLASASSDDIIAKGSGLYLPSLGVPDVNKESFPLPFSIQLSLVGIIKGVIINSSSSVAIR